MTNDIESRAEREAERLRRNGVTVTLGLAVDEKTAAEFIGVSPRTLRAWRSEGRGPRCFVSGRLWFPLVELLRYIETQCDRQEAAAGGS